MNRWFLILLAGLAGGTAQAQSLADPGAIDAEVAAFTGAAIGEPGGAALPLDRRLRLRACPAAHALDWFGARREVVQVSCPVPGGWRIYVPLHRERPGTTQAAAVPVITRGEAVTITVRGEGFAISQQGEALEAGAPGAWIKVRLAGGKAEPVRAQVLRAGAVGIELP